MPGLSNRNDGCSPMTTLEDLPPTISVERAGEILGVSRRSAYRAAQQGELPTVRLGRRLLVPTARLLIMLGVERSDPVAVVGRATAASGEEA
jgi:excisionase family DNA binding protein